MAPVQDPNFRDRLNALSEKYGATIPATMAAIAAALSHCRNADADEQSLHRLHELLHGVAGSAATFGYPVLGTEARRLEQEVRPLLGKRPVEVADWGALEGMVAQYLSWAAIDPKATEYKV
ncbi:Hpt domain-containing protein [Duganella sp. FT92W]|uniref:Hpt domain-containing protein n=1 Tax=Pseudoduganella rivuli TaxID=2666085 RepID=A0A7X2IRC8_9BURK|nr:Hpt domain-containing protein [Pseudoduganella rivuli]MRV74665.1 Hpt domain-containing protein [Pseudoduganella rivuli]